MMTSEQLEELQGEVNDLKATDIEDHLRCADSCETESDFVSNMDDAIEATKLLLKELKDIRKQIN